MLILHVLTVPVFWFWVLLMPEPPASSRSLRLSPWTHICFMAPFERNSWICSPSCPATRGKTGRSAQVFATQGGTHRLAHQNRTIAIASDFRVDGAKSPEIPQKARGSGSEIAAQNRKSLVTSHRTRKS